MHDRIVRATIDAGDVHPTGDGETVPAGGESRRLVLAEPADARSTLASTGIYIFEPAALERIPAGVEYDIGSQLFPALVAEGLPFYAQSRFFNWIDIGRVSDYWSVLQRVLRGDVAQLTMPRQFGPASAKPVVAPVRSATSDPVGRVRSSPCHGSYLWKTWCSRPVPRVSVRNSVRKPTRPRAGIT